MYDVGDKLLNSNKRMYINSATFVRLKGGDTDCFRIDIGFRRGYIMFPYLFNVNIYEVMKEVKIGVGRRGLRFQEEGRELRLSGLLNADDGFVWQVRGRPMGNSGTFC